MERFIQFFSTDRVPRWQIVAFGLFVLLVGWGQSEYYYQKSLSDSRVNTEQLRVENKLVEIQRHSVDFQTFAGAFVSSVLDDAEDVEGRRAALIENILAQDAAVDVSFSLFDQETAGAVTQYRAALRHMRNAIDETSDVVSMTAFWDAASDLLVARNALLEQLERQVRPPTS